MSLSVRQWQSTDRRFVVESWLDSYRHSNFAGLVQMDDWDETMGRAVERILARPGCQVWVALDPEGDPRVHLHGWLACEHTYQVPKKARVNGVRKTVLEINRWPLVHYVFVKHARRRMGMARRLFKAAGVDPAAPFNYTCRTAAIPRVARHIPLARWTPLIARHPKHPLRDDDANDSRSDSSVLR